jgi:dipeptidyl aminopeptidase/acylaminoacyl peptidase
MYSKILVISLALAASALAQTNPDLGKRPFTFEDMMRLKRVGEPAPSPDGKWIVFAASEVDLDANTNKSHLWIVPATGGEARRLNPSENEEERARFSPEGNRIIFTSKATDPSQIWMYGFDPGTGNVVGEARQLTHVSTGADGAIWSPDGRNVLFVSSVYPEYNHDEFNRHRDEELKKSQVKAQIFTKLLYRHWKAFTDFKRSHLFVVNTETPDAEARDLTPGDHDVPPFNLGGQDLYAISPDGQEVAYTSNIDEVEATSTNNEVFLVPITGGTPKKISTSPGNDSTPLYSPDGKYLAWKSMARAGFESDKQALIIYERASGQARNATQDWDRSVGSYTWTPDSKAIFFTAEDHGESPIYALPLEAKEPSKIATLHADDLVFANDGSRLFFTRMSIAAPNEIAALDVSDLLKSGEPGLTNNAAELSATPVTHMNDALLAEIAMQPLEPFTFKGAANADVQGFLVKPPGFDPAKKYPVKFLIHGGPQGAWGDSWSFRWNPELFAAIGHYIVVMINPHGSTGYGQAFTDAVSGDWGGKPYIDLMKGLDYAEKTYPFIDKTREAALGASYGGYMVNWIMGQTDRFKCIVSHDGMFNTESAYGTTEELWFPEWEFKGPPWKNRELYRKFSPHLNAEKFKTPTLVIHGQLDYRLDVSEGFQLFTTLQRMKVPSKMLYFPDEGHWVTKPQNSRLWYLTVNDWVNQWCTRQ